MIGENSSPHLLARDTRSGWRISRRDIAVLAASKTISEDGSNKLEKVTRDMLGRARRVSALASVS